MSNIDRNNGKMARNFASLLRVSHTGRYESDMKGWLELNKLPPPVGLKPGTARSAGQC